MRAIGSIETKGLIGLVAATDTSSPHAPLQNTEN